MILFLKENDAKKRNIYAKTCLYLQSSWKFHFTLMFTVGRDKSPHFLQVTKWSVESLAWCSCDNVYSYNDSFLGQLVTITYLKSGTIREIFWLLPALSPLLPVVSHLSFVSTRKRRHFSLWIQSCKSILHVIPSVF
jgi:hypothetical protein